MARISVLLDVLTGLIALLGYAPLFPYLEWVPRLCLPLALICGHIAGRKGLRLSGPVSTVVSIIFFFYYAARFGQDNIAGPAVNLLIVLLAVRLVSERKARHYLQIFALSLFSLAGSSLFTLDIDFLAYLLVLFFLIAVALVILTFHASDERLALSGKQTKTLLSVALLMPAGALPLMTVFFIILPRTQYPLWNFLNTAGPAVTGFSEKVQPGSAAGIGEAKRVAFRVSCGRLPPELLYWRGIVLNAQAGNAWIRVDPPPGENGRIAAGNTMHQTVFPEPGMGGYITALNVPVRISGVRGSLSGDYVEKSGNPGGKRGKYEAVSIPGGAIALKTGIDRSFYLKLPDAVSRRLEDAAQDIAARAKTDEDKLELIKRFFRSRNLSYATSGLPVSAAPLDEFLFTKRRGNCEFFASSFALLLRLSGVPSRLVGGYYGGEYNELGGYYLVKEEMAHVWVEAYLSDKGWVMFDPSTLAAGFRYAGEEGSGGAARRLAMLLDSCSYYWNIAVIAYDLDKQLQLAGRLDFRLRHFPMPAHPGKAALQTGAMLILLIIIIYAVRLKRTSREEKLLRRFLRIMKRRYGLELLPSTGLHELAARCDDSRMAEFVSIYSRAFYHDRKLSDREYRQLQELLRI
ncbi:MAG TPA: DUF3488 and transglutaminase-like domain-containing protein [Geobacteraceae bacterium]|nr:DUF3488 and transglutaminase-like domain-containing protein [Geobacteraceae bacterium]